MKNNFYELTYIITPVLEAEQFAEVVKKFSDFITTNGATIEEMDEWGLKKMSYDMDKKSTGYYVNLYLNGPSDLVAKLERAMAIDDRIMRFLCLKYDAKMLRHRELQKKGEVPSIFKKEEDEVVIDDTEI
jgi:small subunit ribosomal protein S6